MYLAFSSQQRALDAALEVFDVLGAPVILPAIAPTWVLASVLRAGGCPILVDITTDYCYDLVKLQEVLADTDGAIVLLYSPEDVPSCRSSLPCLEKVTTITISPFLPSVDVGTTMLISSTYTGLEDPTTACGILSTDYLDLFNAVKDVRSGTLGMGDYITATDQFAIDNLSHDAVQHHYFQSRLRAAVYDHALKSKGVVVSRTPRDRIRHISLDIPNAFVIAKALHTAMADVQVIQNLAYVPDVSKILDLPGDFPVADRMHGRRLLLPCDVHVSVLDIEQAATLVAYYLAES